MVFECMSLWEFCVCIHGCWASIMFMHQCVVMYCEYVIACNSEWVYTCNEVCITHEGSTEISPYSQDQG